jgi:hypothetical protein
LWAEIANRLKVTGPEFLTPRTYLAVLEAAPFMDESLTKGADLKAKSVILGIVKEGNDGG